MPKSPRPADETCKTCVYWSDQKDFGECRCDPPLLFDDGETGWPRTDGTMWCGNYNDDWTGRYKKDAPT